MKSAFLALLWLLFAAPLAADDVLFVKNQWKYRLYIWANDVYQGYVDPGRVAYMPQEGFVTEDSGFQSDGSLKMDHSYGGWPVATTFSIAGASAAFANGDTKMSFYGRGSEPYNGANYKQWVFGYAPDGSLAPPDGVELEHAMKMRREPPPRKCWTSSAKESRIIKRRTAAPPPG